MIEKTPLLIAIESLDIRTVENLIQEGANVNDILEDDLRPIDIAAEQCGHEALAIVSALLKAKATIDGGSYSTLCIAVNCGNTEIALKLLDAKADVNKASPLGRPLSIALQHHDKKMVGILLKKKADTSNEELASTLLKAVQERNAHRLINILLEHKIAVPTPPILLKKAIDLINPLDVRALLKAKACIEPKNTKPPLLMAAEKNSHKLEGMEKAFEIFQLLIAEKADIGVLKNWNPSKMMMMASEHLPRLLKLLSPWVEPTKAQWYEGLSKAVLKEMTSSPLEVLFKAKAPLTLTKPLLKLAQERCVDQSIIDLLENKQKIMTVLSVFFKKKKFISSPPEKIVREEKHRKNPDWREAGAAAEALDLETLKRIAEGHFVVLSRQIETPLIKLSKSANPEVIAIIKILLLLHRHYPAGYYKAEGSDESLFYFNINDLHLAALMKACSLGRLGVVEVLLNPPPDRVLSVALEKAVINKHKKVAAKLLEYKVEPDETTRKAAVRDHELLKMLLDAKASTYGLIHKSIYCRNENSLRVLIAANASIEEPNFRFESPLLNAVLIRDSVAATILLEAKANIGVKDATGNGVIHTAIASSDQPLDLPLCLLLLKAKANFKKTNHDGYTPLEALILRKTKTVSQLCADISSFLALLKSEDDLAYRQSALQVAKKFYKHRSIIDALEYYPSMVRNPLLDESTIKSQLTAADIKTAAVVQVARVKDHPLSLQKDLLAQTVSAGDAKMLRSLLAHKADMKGLGLFRKAILLGDATVLGVLVTANVNLEDRDSEDLTPLLFAVKNGFPKAVELLIRAKADVGAVDKMGNTALHLLIDDNLPCMEICSQLLKSKADVNAKNNRGYTFLQEAILSRIPNTHLLAFLSACVSALGLDYQAVSCRQSALKLAKEQGKDVRIINALYGSMSDNPLLLETTFAPALEMKSSRAGTVDSALNPLAFLPRRPRYGLFDKQALRLVLRLADVAIKSGAVRRESGLSSEVEPPSPNSFSF